MSREILHTIHHLHHASEREAVSNPPQETEGSAFLRSEPLVTTQYGEPDRPYSGDMDLLNVYFQYGGLPIACEVPQGHFNAHLMNGESQDVTYDDGSTELLPGEKTDI